MSKIAIVTAVYNAEKYISQTIEGVQAQTVDHWHLILVDDGSKDRSAEIIQAYAAEDDRIEYVYQANTGAAGARNRGLKLAREEFPYIMFLDHDDILFPDALARLEDALLEDDSYSAAYGLPRKIDFESNILFEEPELAYGYNRVVIQHGRKVALDPQAGPSPFESFLYWDNIETPGQVLIRRNFLIQHGGFDAMCEPLEDWDIWLKLALSGPFRFIPDFIIDYRTHAESISNNSYRNRRANLLVRQKLAMNSKLTPEQFSAARGGHFYSALDTFQWAWHSLRSGKILRAGNQTIRGIRNVWLYVKTWHFNFGF